MQRLISATVIALLVAPFSVSAETLTPAQQATKEQLAAHLKVDPAKYTLSELARLNCRMETASSDAERERLRNQPLDFAPLPSEQSAAAHAQLASALGVDPADYTAAQLSMLKSMVEDEDCTVRDPASFAKRDEHMTEGSARAKIQLARSLGVDPTQHSLKELLDMRFGPDNDS